MPGAWRRSLFRRGSFVRRCRTERITAPESRLYGRFAPQIRLDLPGDAVEQLTSVGLPVEIEGMFYADPHSFLRERSFGDHQYYFLGTNEKEVAGSYLTRRPDGQVWNLSVDETEMLFCNSSLPLFLTFLAQWRGFLLNCRGIVNEGRVIKEGKKLRKELRKLDRAAFKGEETWWSFVCEEVEDGVLVPGED
ncbi:SUKH-4 family immunity protein [Micromonospora sp. DT31]|uniref:SUKH-4 family immunity protein n=1 Tax=Micromonospora sp. DT31 TaxID=3393434 RepID=UPI003CF4E481